MQRQTREKFNGYITRIAELNNIPADEVAKKFTVEPSVEQKLEEKIQEQSNFLAQVNNVQVDQLKGQKVGIGVASTIASRTDTSTHKRTPQPIGVTDSREYELKQTNYDTYLTYAQLDTWRHRPEFQVILANAVNKQIARDRLMITFNGISAAADTVRTSNQLLQDVNIGWLQHLRTEKSAAVMSGKKIGDASGADYKNIDAAVFDAANELIEDPYRDDSGLVVIAGRKLLSDKYLGFINEQSKPTEINALNTILTNKLIGTMPVIRVPFFPANAFFITRLDNLSIYTQRGATRRAIIDRPEWDRIEDYRSVNEAYVVENLDACCLVEGILTPDGSGSWA